MVIQLVGGRQQDTSTCTLALLSPGINGQLTPLSRSANLGWRLNWAIAPDEYYFVEIRYPHNGQPNEYYFANVEFPHGGQTWYDGTWRDAGQQLPDGTPDTSFARGNHLCRPGFSDTGQYTWYVAVLNQSGGEKILTGQVMCRSEKRVFSWTGCVPPTPPEPGYDEDQDTDDEYWDD